MRSSINRIPKGKPSFNKIQSWLQQIQSVQKTQRMLLNGGSRMLEGSKLRNKSRQSKPKAYPSNKLIQINNESKVFKISSYDDESTMISKSFVPIKKQKPHQKCSKIYSQGTSPRQNYKQAPQSVNNKMARTTNFLPRETLKLNTKQFKFKMKSIKRVQSASQKNKGQLKKDCHQMKMEKILDWRGEIVSIIKNEQNTRNNSPRLHKKVKTTPSSPRILKHGQTNVSSLIQQEYEKILLKTTGSFKNGLEQTQHQVGPNIFGKRNLLSTRSKSKSNFNLLKKQTLIKEPSINPRLKLQLQIQHKLFHMKQASSKPLLILKKLNDALNPRKDFYL